VIYVETPAVVSTSETPDADGPSNEHQRAIFRSFERDWKTTRNAQRQLDGLQKQLLDMQSRLGTMNRNLNPEEALYADRADHDDWRDARRWLRDASNRLNKGLKELVAGETTYAGKNQWFEQFYRDYISTQTPFPGSKRLAASPNFNDARFRICANACSRLITTPSRKGFSELKSAQPNRGEGHFQTSEGTRRHKSAGEKMA
jgi:hypothetical protein